MKLSEREIVWATRNNDDGRCAGCQILFGFTELDTEKMDEVNSFKKLGFLWCEDCIQRRRDGVRIGVDARRDLPFEEDI
jgi:hypothetical protein